MQKHKLVERGGGGGDVASRIRATLQSMNRLTENDLVIYDESGEIVGSDLTSLLDYALARVETETKPFDAEIFLRFLISELGINKNELAVKPRPWRRIPA